jgi:hypothetical protein
MSIFPKACYGFRGRTLKPRKPWLRWHVLRTLLHKEVLRHLANRGGIVLVLLLIVASLLLSFFGNGPPLSPCCSPPCWPAPISLPF